MKSHFLREVAAKIIAKMRATGSHIDAWAETSTLNNADVERTVHFYTKIGWRVLVWGFGGLILLSTIAPLDRGVTASGWVIAEGQRKVVQATSAGIIDEILVTEGQPVKAGQVLVKLNQVNASASFGMTEQNVLGLEQQIVSLEAASEQKRLQLQALTKQLSNVQSLAKEGYVPRNRALELEQQQNFLRAQIAADQATLAGLNRELGVQKERLAPASQDLANTELRSPVDGSVVNLQVFTRGGVLAIGSRVLEVVPTDQPLVVEAQVPVHLIDKVHKDLPVEMMFTALNQNRTPHIPGVVTVVGDDRIVDERTGMPYFKLLAEATPEGKKLLGDNKVRPGMPVEVFVKTGERSLMSYLLKPLLDRMHSSLREE